MSYVTFSFNIIFSVHLLQYNLLYTLGKHLGQTGSDIPDSLKFHQTLRTFLNDKVYDFHFYISKSWPEDPICLHFPGMTKSPNGLLYESFSVYCPHDCLDRLDLLQTEDVLIDWTKPLFINFIHSAIMDRIESFYQDIGTLEKVYGDVYMCSEPSNDLSIEQLPSEEIVMKQLTKDNVETIHNLYPANDMEDIDIFKILVNVLPAYGIFDSTTGQLAAWMMQSYYGAMFSMQTLPEFRRKGYGFYLAQYLTRVVHARGYIPFVVIRPENDASQSLYMKLGFRKVYQTTRAILTPKDA
ncbi:uncharacterized protein LOC103522579 [Diaphorina citri]|uniref:Uncharacterized protein LOC103522579 n=1 Tax=Diaphorina citri TaxID=121845 RepID=A0A3Q0JMQ3_DIACI|nr:uncharacterized protein LOC103522579 [Diaphorina citri]